MSATVKMPVSPLDEEVVLSISSGVIVHESRSYNDLSDKPSLDGVTIQGEMHETDPTVGAWASELEELKKMVIQNQYYAPLIIDDEDHALLVDDNTILLADWKYKEQ